MGDFMLGSIEPRRTGAGVGGPERLLTPAEVARYRQQGVPLAYDCAHNGWVLAPENESVVRRVAATRPAANVVDSAEEMLFRARVRRESRGGADVAKSPTIAEATEFSFRPWTLADLPAYTRLLRNPAVWRYLPENYPEPFTDETARGLMEVGTFEFLHEALAVIHDERPIGQCLFRPDEVTATARVAEVAYWLGEEHWGRGYMSRILPLFSARCFRAHPVDALYLWIRGDHAASARVAVKAGYRRDDFPGEPELADRSGRPGCVRYVMLRPVSARG